MRFIMTKTKVALIAFAAFQLGQILQVRQDAKKFVELGDAAVLELTRQDMIIEALQNN